MLKLHKIQDPERCKIKYMMMKIFSFFKDDEEIIIKVSYEQSFDENENDYISYYSSTDLYLLLLDGVGVDYSAADMEEILKKVKHEMKICNIDAR